MGESVMTVQASRLVLLRMGSPTQVGIRPLAAGLVIMSSTTPAMRCGPSSDAIVSLSQCH